MPADPVHERPAPPDPFPRPSTVMLVPARTTRLTATLVLLLGTLAAAAEDPPPGRKVTLPAGPLTPAEAAAAIRKQAGTDLDVSALDAKPVAVDAKDVGAWVAVERLAEATDSRAVLTGGKVALRPGKSKYPSSVSGPFRIGVREVLARGDAEAGTSHYTVQLEAAWEPWLLTYRIDTVPKITAAEDDTGKALGVGAGSSRTFTAGTAAPLTVRPEGLTRAAKSVTLRGSIMVTVADELLTFQFDAAGKPGAAPAQKGVEVTATKFGPDGNDWVAEISMRYPKGSAVWESHEFYWARNNVLELVPPKGNPIPATAGEFGEGSVRYVFKNRAKQVGPGWAFRYRTPGPMREVTVPFELKGVPLP